MPVFGKELLQNQYYRVTHLGQCDILKKIQVRILLFFITFYCGRSANGCAKCETNAGSLDVGSAYVIYHSPAEQSQACSRSLSEINYSTRRIYRCNKTTYNRVIRRLFMYKITVRTQIPSLYFTWLSLELSLKSEASLAHNNTWHFSKRFLNKFSSVLPTKIFNKGPK